MNHRERLHAALRGEPTDGVPIALWRHFPKDDLRAETLAARVVEFQREFDFDFVKVTPASGYPAEMYGATFVDGRNREGTREYTSRPVKGLEDWGRIVALDETNPVFARELAALRLIRERLGAEVHILQTIFSPLYTADRLAGGRTRADLRARPDVMHRVLAALTETTARFAAASLRAGADAIFFATQMATREYIAEDEFCLFGERYDLQVLEQIRAHKPAFILLHIHGTDIYFERLARWDVDALNWHDRVTAPSLHAAREMLRAARQPKALVGGIDAWGALATQSRDAVMAQARDALAQTGGRGFVLSAGCVTLVDTPAKNIRALVEWAREQKIN